VNLVELENALKKAQASHAAHIFVFAHEMAFTCTNHGDDDNMAKYPEERDKFVDLLQSYGCEYFFAGHDHAYDWMSIKHTKWPAGYVLNQIVAGTAGAPFYEDKKILRRPSRVRPDPAGSQAEHSRLSPRHRR